MHMQLTYTRAKDIRNDIALHDVLGDRKVAVRDSVFHAANMALISRSSGLMTIVIVCIIEYCANTRCNMHYRYNTL